MKSAFVGSKDGFFSSNAVELSAGLSLLESAVTHGGATHAAEAARASGTAITISDGAAKVLARCVVIPGETAAQLGYLGLSSALLGTSAVAIEVELLGEEPRLIPALVYAMARRARCMERVSLLIAASPHTQQSFELMHARALASAPGYVNQRVDVAAHHASLALEQALSPVNPELRAREAEETIKRWLAGCGDWGFFKAIANRTLTRSQYVYALSNIYQFVRQTTRLAARAVAHSPTTDMRSHFIQHLVGEVNHELIIERDLSHLGEDVAYVRDAMAPNGPTQEFMAIQESMIGYYQDPVLLMASPMAAEGVSAHLDDAFVKGLKESIASWGVPQPERCAKFFISHIHTDGGDDGHWEMTVKFLSTCLLSEAKHQLFMRSMRSAMRGTRRLYDSFVDEMPNLDQPGGARTDDLGRSEVRA